MSAFIAYWLYDHVPLITGMYYNPRVLSVIKYTPAMNIWAMIGFIICDNKFLMTLW